MTYSYFPDVKTNAIFSAEGPEPQSLHVEGQLKVLAVGMEAGQKIPVHPEGLAVYTVLEGKGYMIVDEERLSIGPGTTVVTREGAQRGIEAETQLVFLAVRISLPSHWDLEAYRKEALTRG